ncbi:hypothetical protein [Laspinema olomoucense]|nr:hypothetical protein [Laspinema sp. D3b]
MMQGVVADRLVSLDCFARWTCSAVEVRSLMTRGDRNFSLH